MTCIVGLVDGGRVWMGGDSFGYAQWDDVTHRADPKVFCKDPYVIGFTTSYRMGQLLRYGIDMPAPAPDRDLMEFMVVDFVNALRAGYKAGGWATKTDEQEAGGCFLVGVHGRLFRIDSDYNVGESADGFAAVGSGIGAAHGALFVSQGQPPEARVLGALKAAERFSAGVRGPFVVRAGGCRPEGSREG